jgi:RNA polymerase sigma factor (sigma-70 family)
MQQREMIEALREGDRDAFREFVAEHQNKVFSLALSFLKNREEAEDIAQDVFVEVFQSINSFRKEAELSSWIYRITVNKSLNRYKRMKRMLPQEEDNMLGFLQQSESNPETQMQSKENAKVLYVAVDKLPEKQKTAYTLRHFNDLSYNEISKIMKKSKSSVESLIHRAHKKLYSLLYDYYEENMR